MAKYYIKCGTLELIFSTNKDPLNAAVTALGEINEYDELDEHFYIDERGMRDYSNAKPNTVVISTKEVMNKAGWELET